MQLFCGPDSASFYSPTKQRLLCGGRPGLSVLLESLSARVDRSMVDRIDLDSLVSDESLFVDQSPLVLYDFAPPEFTYVPAVKSTNLKVRTPSILDFLYKKTFV